MQKKVMKNIILIFFTTLLSACNVNHIGVDDFHDSKERAYYCEQIIQGEENLSNNCVDKATGKTLADRNKALLDKKYPEERGYLGNREPKLGLALSGGGTRAATFSIGVMKALKEQGILDQVEIISSVSGGSYASYWYLSKLFYQAKLGTNIEYGYELFRDDTSNALNGSTSACLAGANSLNPANCYRFQYMLENSSKILSFSKKPGFWSSIKNGVEVVTEASTQVLSMPFHWAINGFFDWEVNMTPYRKFYQNGLERTYGYMPRDISLTSFENDESLVVPRVYATQLSFQEIRDDFWNNPRLRDSNTKPPLFVINTTARYARLAGGRSHDDQRDLEKEVFEFTPWRCGSLLFGYKNIDNCGGLSWSKVVSISGGAVDGQYSKLDDNGNRLETDFSDKLLAGVLNVFNADIGYHIDNYNADTFDVTFHKILPFPLFVLHDWYLSDSYVENDKSSSIYLNDGGASENLGLFSLIQRGVERIIVIDAEHDPSSSFQAAKFVKTTLANYGLEFILNTQGIIVYDAIPKKAVIKGIIKGWVDEHGNSKNIELIYIKLAVEAKPAQSNGHGVNYPYSVRYFRDLDKEFPHNSTGDVSYESEQYKAYRDLGYTLGWEVGCKNNTINTRSQLIRVTTVNTECY